MDAWAHDRFGEGTEHGPRQIGVAVGTFQVLAKPGASVDSGGDVHRVSPQVVVWKLHLEIDAMNVVFGGYRFSSRARTPLVGTQLRQIDLWLTQTITRVISARRSNELEVIPFDE